MKLLLLIFLTGCAQVKFAQTERALSQEKKPDETFVIASDTGEEAWNKVGNIIAVPRYSMNDQKFIRIVNEDSKNHQLKTDGAPCASSPVLKKGDSWDCVIEKDFEGYLKDGVTGARVLFSTYGASLYGGSNF